MVTVSLRSQPMSIVFLLLCVRKHAEVFILHYMKYTRPKENVSSFKVRDSGYSCKFYTFITVRSLSVGVIPAFQNCAIHKPVSNSNWE